MMRKAQLFLVFSILSLIGCNNSVDSPLGLEILPSSQTGVTFINKQKESPTQNVLNYEYYYNGAGVAIGDFNNDELPDIYLISNIEENRMYLNQGAFKFKDISKPSKTISTRGFCTGVTTVDINNDGLLDIYLCKSGRFDDAQMRKNELFVNMGNNEAGIPVFEQKAELYGLDIEAYSTQASFFDYDLDGDLDMFLINHGIDTYDIKDIAKLKNESDPLMGERLYKNENNKYIDVTNSAGIINNKLGFGLGLSISDLNKDHYPDVYVSNDYSGKDHLYINQKDGTFKEKINEVTNQISFYAMGNDIGDINNDGWPDIVNLDMVAAENYGIKTSMSAMNPTQFHDLVNSGEHHQYMYNSLLLNSGISSENELPFFSNIAQMSGVSNTDWSWAPLLFDMDNDGWQDLFISNGIKRNIRNNDALKKVKDLNERRLNTKNEREKISLTQKILELFPYHQKPNYFFRNNTDLNFSDISKEMGLDSVMSMSSGASYADLDLDGDLDLVVNNSDQAAFIIRNNAAELGTGNSISIKLVGSKKNRLGLGARVTIQGEQGVQSKELYTCRGYMSAVEPLLHFGIGKQDMIKEVKVEWSDGKVQVINNVKAGRLVVKYSDAAEIEKKEKSNQTIFSKNTTSPIDISHKENIFDDFAKESLLPHKMSNMGPASAVGDVNNDGILDVFIGGAQGFESQLLLGKSNGGYDSVMQLLWSKDREYEDVSACFFDSDSDGDLDLVVGSGSNDSKMTEDPYLLRFYENNGKGDFIKNMNVLPKINISTGVIRAGDLDGDKDLDLFVGGRQTPGRYPLATNSYILINQGANNGFKFFDKTRELAPILENYGMVTDAILVDVNKDSFLDIVTVGEWMSPKILLNNEKGFDDYTKSSGLEDELGWWNTIVSADFDQDGDLDFIAGNLGLNYKYKASKEKPFEVFANDFDDNGTFDVVLSYYEEEKLVPLRGRECSSTQMPFIKEKFKTYDAFAKASVHNIFEEKDLNQATHYRANNFAHCYFENKGNMDFEVSRLPIETQISSINSIQVYDFNNDDILDLLVGGNLYGSEVETPRNDASIGHYLQGEKDGGFKVLPYYESGFRTKGEIREIHLLGGRSKPLKILIVKNGATAEWFKVNN